MTFISMKMITKAVGMVISRTAVAATTNRTSGRLSLRKVRAMGPMTTITPSPTTPSTVSSGMTVKMILPGSVSRPHARPMTATYLSTPPMIGSSEAMIAIVSATRLPGISSADALEVDERGVVDPQPERLVGAVADGVDGVLAARTLDRRVGPARVAASGAAAAWP